jgi:hypothetical protein
MLTTANTVTMRGMSSDTREDAPADPDYVTEDEEVVDGLPVLAEVRTLEPAAAVALPAVQAAAAAATGFVAGAATLALLRRHSARRLARARLSTQRRGPAGLPVVASRSFLVDVHLLAKPGD